MRFGWDGLAGCFLFCSSVTLIYHVLVTDGTFHRLKNWHELPLTEFLVFLLVLVFLVVASKALAVLLHLLSLLWRVRRLRSLAATVVKDIAQHPPLSHDSRTRRILVCHASVGSGHQRAALAVEAAIHKLDSAAEVRVIDVMGPPYADRTLIRIYKDWYLRMVGGETMMGSLGGHCMGFFFDRTNNVTDPFTGGSAMQRRLTQVLLLNFLQAVLDFAPDVVVHTHFLAPELLSSLRRRHGLRVPHITVVTDMDVHAWWFQQPTEHYFVHRDFARSQLVADGVPEGDISVSGIPIMPDFQDALDTAAGLSKQERIKPFLRRMDVPLDPLVFGWDTDKQMFNSDASTPIVVQMSTGKTAADVYQQLLGTQTPIILVVVCGRQADVSESLKKLPVPDRHRVAFIGFTKTLHELLVAADVLVTKPGGLITAEAFACGLCVVVVDPYPGQEERNASLIQEAGVGIRIWDVRDLPLKMDAVLSPTRLKEFQQRAKGLAQPDAAITVAKYVLSGAPRTRMEASRFESTDCATNDDNSDSDFDPSSDSNASVEGVQAFESLGNYFRQVLSSSSLRIGRAVADDQSQAAWSRPFFQEAVANEPSLPKHRGRGPLKSGVSQTLPDDLGI